VLHTAYEANVDTLKLSENLVAIVRPVWINISKNLFLITS